MQERFRNNLNFKIILIIQCSSLHFAGSKIKAHSVLLGSGQAAAMGLAMLHCKSTYSDLRPCQLRRARHGQGCCRDASVPLPWRVPLFVPLFGDQCLSFPSPSCPPGFSLKALPCRTVQPLPNRALISSSASCVEYGVPVNLGWGAIPDLGEAGVPH